MTKAEKILKELDERDARDAATRAAMPVAPPAPKGPNKYDGMSADRRSMALANIVFDLEQPRKDFDEVKLAQLAASIGSYGVLEPVMLRWSQSIGKWIVVFGERRVRAARMAGLKEILFNEHDAKTTQDENDDAARDRREEIQLVENIQRDDLKPSELAAKIKQYIARKPGRTQKEIAAKLGLSAPTISNYLAVSQLPAPILNLVDARMLPLDVGVELAKIEDDVEQVRLAEKIVKEGMNRVDALREAKTQRPAKPNAATRPKKAVRHEATNGVIITASRKEPPTDVEIRDALREMIEGYEEQRRAA